MKSKLLQQLVLFNTNSLVYTKIHRQKITNLINNKQTTFKYNKNNKWKMKKKFPV